MKFKKRCIVPAITLCALIAAAGCSPAQAQSGMSGGMNAASMFLMDESSGTGFQPSAWKMPMLMTETGEWNLMWMAQAFLVDTQQSSPRGGDKLYSTNWGMLSAIHPLGKGAVMLRSMLSLEPATVTERRYPLLFQVGETAFGQPIVDAQHPHDLFMEVGVQYAYPLSEKAMWNVYYAPVGDPALGPVAYPHRASAMELPQATLGHHWEDSTHIADDVVTTGITYKKVRLEASGFYGREPDENRWNFDFGSMDSWSTRFSVFPTENWAAQISMGRLHHPEALEAGDVVRTTASLEYIRPLGHNNSWATSLIWGQDYKKDEQRRTNSVTAESLIPFAQKNFMTGRYEWSQRDELFPYDEARAGLVFPVHAFTAGYTRDLALVRNIEVGLGTNVSAYVVSEALKPFYGAHPWGVNVFLRVRLKPSA